MKHIFRLLTLLVIASFFLPARAQTPDWQWARQGRGADPGLGRSIGTDPDGNVFVAGSFEGSVAFGTTSFTSPGATDVFLTKYDSTGRVLWAKRAGGFQAVKATGLSVDKQGNVYVVGSFRGIAQFDGTTLQNPNISLDDLFIARYSNAGTLLWIRQVGSPEISEEATGVSADANGGVYLTGRYYANVSDETLVPVRFGSVTANIPGRYGIFLAKYDAEGTGVWAQGNTARILYPVAITGVASDAAGNAYITGSTYMEVTMDGLRFGPSDPFAKMFAFVGKFNPQGKMQWLTGTTAQGDHSNKAAGYGIAVDQQENAYVAGLLQGAAGFGNDLVLNSLAEKDLFLAKYDRNGGLQWVRQAANACAETGMLDFGDEVYAASVCLDAQQRPTVTGSFQRTAQFGNIQLLSTGNTDVYAAQYDQEGNARWARAAGGVGRDVGYGIASDGKGRFYLTGSFSGTARFGGEVLTSGGNAPNVFTARVAPCPDQNPVITPSATAVCQGDTVLLRVNTLAGQTYQWKKDGAPLAGATASSYKATQAGIYSVLVTVRNCTAESPGLPLDLDSRPAAALLDAAPAAVCTGDSLAIRVQAAGGATYQWLRNNVVVGGATAPLLYARTPGNYRVVVINSAGCRDTSAVKRLSVNDLPEATVAANGSALLCQTDVATLSANAGPGFTYQWLLDGRPLAGATAATLQARQLGDYAVIVTNAAGCSRQSDALSVVNAKITAAVPTFCPGDSVLLTANAGAGLSYGWFKDNVPVAGATAATLYAKAAGAYTVQVRNGSGCTATSAPLAVRADVLPQALLLPAGDLSLCRGDSVDLSTPAVAGLTYQWRRDGVAIAGATGATLRVKTAGTYSVLVATAGGCTTLSAARGVTFSDRPAALVSPAGPVSLCAGEPVLLRAEAAPGLRYQWQRENANLAGATGSSLNATAAGVYTVTVTNAGGCGQQSAPTLVQVNPLPPALVRTAGPLTRCQGDSVLLRAPEGGGQTYGWFRDGEPIAGASGAGYYARTGGSYTVRVDNGTCAAVSEPVAVTFVPFPAATASVAGPSSFCPGDSTELRAGPADGVTYQWKKDGVRLEGAVRASYAATSAGRYTLEVTNAAGCTAVSEPLVISTFAPLPTGLAAGGSTRFCRGDSVRLSAAPGQQYQWFRNDTLLAGATGSDYTARLAGTYTVQLTGANGCQVRSVPAVVTTDQPPVAGIVSPASASFCTGEVLALRAVEAPGFSYQWQRDSQDIHGATAAAYEAGTAGAYRVKVTSGTCTRFSEALSVTEKAKLAKPVIGQRKDTLLTAGGAARYQWFLHGTPVPGATGAQWGARQTGIYTVEVENANGCRTVSDRFLLTFDCELLLYPNPFTDVLNLEVGSATLGKVTIRVYNVVGKLMLAKEADSYRMYYRESFPIGAWARGVYLVEVESCGHRIMKRMFKN